MPEFFDLQLDRKPILVGKSFRLSNFNNLSLSADKNNSTILIDPYDLPDIEYLKEFIRDNGDLTGTTLLSNRKEATPRELKTLREIKEIWETRTDKEEGIYAVLLYISYIKSDSFTSMTYTACAVDPTKCKKKVNIGSDGFYECTTCNKSTKDCNYRYILSVSVADMTDSVFAGAFDDIGNQLFKINGNRLVEISVDQTAVEELIQDVVRKEYMCTLKAQISDGGQNGLRPKYTILKLDPAVENFADMLMNDISQGMRNRAY